MKTRFPRWLAVPLLACLAPVIGTVSCTSAPGAPAAAPISAAATLALDKPLPATVLYSSPNPILALAADKNDNVYAVVYETGELVKIAPDGTATSLYTGLKSCGFGAYAALAILPNGDVVTYDCADGENATIEEISPSGAKTTLAAVDEDGNLMSLAADPSGKVFAGLWTSGDSKLTVVSSPNHITAAENITGYVATLGENGQLDRVYEGGLPTALAAADDGTVLAALWGQGGGFSEESREYSVCTGTNMFWIILSDQVELRQVVTGGQQQAPVDQLNAVSALAVGKGGLVVAAGMSKGEDASCGLFYTYGAQDPRELSLVPGDLDEDITSLALTDRNLYFATVDGNIVRVSLAP